MSLIMGQVIPDHTISALEIEKLNFSNLFGIYFHCYPVLFSNQVSHIGSSWSSCIIVIIVKNVSFDRYVQFVKPLLQWLVLGTTEN